MSTAAERDGYRTINFEETELRLGLPGGGGVEAGNTKSNGKRGFSEDDVVDLKLNLSSSLAGKGDVRSDDIAAGGGDKAAEIIKHKATAPRPTSDHAKPPAKAQVVGWPPVRSFRKNIMAVQKPGNSNTSSTKELRGAETVAASDSAGTTSSSAASFVKVSMDGAPYLRKVDLKLYKSYQQLSEALTKMFSSFTIGNCGSQGTKDFLSESKLIDLLNTSEYVPSYEDKDGDWMLVGDVPWEMFVDLCKRLRIMKGSEAIGLAPRAVEKCKSRS